MLVKGRSRCCMSAGNRPLKGSINPPLPLIHTYSVICFCYICTTSPPQHLDIPTYLHPSRLDHGYTTPLSLFLLFPPYRNTQPTPKSQQKGWKNGRKEGRKIYEKKGDKDICLWSRQISFILLHSLDKLIVEIRTQCFPILPKFPVSFLQYNNAESHNMVAADNNSLQVQKHRNGVQPTSSTPSREPRAIQTGRST